MEPRPVIAGASWGTCPVDPDGPERSAGAVPATDSAARPRREDAGASVVIGDGEGLRVADGTASSSTSSSSSSKTSSMMTSDSSSRGRTVVGRPSGSEIGGGAGWEGGRLPQVPGARATGGGRSRQPPVATASRRWRRGPPQRRRRPHAAASAGGRGSRHLQPASLEIWRAGRQIRQGREQGLPALGW